MSLLLKLRPLLLNLSFLLSPRRFGGLPRAIKDGFVGLGEGCIEEANGVGCGERTCCLLLPQLGQPPRLMQT
jgi:hypothetical protein